MHSIYPAQQCKNGHKGYSRTMARRGGTAATHHPTLLRPTQPQHPLPRQTLDQHLKHSRNTYLIPRCSPATPSSYTYPIVLLPHLPYPIFHGPPALACPQQPRQPLFLPYPVSFSATSIPACTFPCTFCTLEQYSTMSRPGFPVACIGAVCAFLVVVVVILLLLVLVLVLVHVPASARFEQPPFPPSPPHVRGTLAVRRIPAVSHSTKFLDLGLASNHNQQQGQTTLAENGTLVAGP